MNKIPYQIALVGPSGHGKTYALRNMDSQSCGFINLEGKPLPFPNKFKHYNIPNNWQETYQTLIDYAKNPEIKVVVLDSFSAYIDSLLGTARAKYKNFDIWNYYNDEIGRLLIGLIKKYPKDIIITAHTTSPDSDNGSLQKISVKGSEWNKAGIEHVFTIVLFADVKVIEGKRKYVFTFNSDGNTTAKTPPMFLTEDEEFAENDANAFLVRINKVLNEE